MDEHVEIVTKHALSQLNAHRSLDMMPDMKQFLTENTTPHRQVIILGKQKPPPAPEPQPRKITVGAPPPKLGRKTRETLLQEQLDDQRAILRDLEKKLLTMCGVQDRQLTRMAERDKRIQFLEEENRKFLYNQTQIVDILTHLGIKFESHDTLPTDSEK